MISTKTNERIEEIKAEVNKEFKAIPTMKVYSNHIPVNTVTEKLKHVPSRIRGAMTSVYLVLEGHKNYKSEVYASQETIAQESGFGREWVNKIIKKLTEIGLIEKIRRGLNKSNLYILTVAKNLEQKINSIRTEIMQQYKREQEEKAAKRRERYGKSKKKDDIPKNSFNDYDGQRNYDFNKMEQLINGELDVDDLRELEQ